MRELGTLFELSHPAILEVQTLLMAGRFRYLVCEYLGEGSLRDLIVRGDKDVTEGLALLRQAATGVAYAHRRGIFHRDLKPENILLTRNEGGLVAKVSDFGLAALISTGGRSSIGSPAYMAPEQFYDVYDHRVDIYGLGVIAYELICGRRPFYGSPAQIMMAQVRVDPTMPAWIPPETRRVLRAALAKNPDDRTARVEDLIEGLDRILCELKSQPIDDRWPVRVDDVQRLATTCDTVLCLEGGRLRRFDHCGRLIEEQEGVIDILAVENHDVVRLEDRLILTSPVARRTIPMIPPGAQLALSAEGKIACLDRGGLVVVDGLERRVVRNEGEGVVAAAFVGEDQCLWQVVEDENGHHQLETEDGCRRLPAAVRSLHGHTDRDEAVARFADDRDEVLLIDRARVVPAVLDCRSLTCDGDNFCAVDRHGRLTTINVRSTRVARTNWESPLAYAAAARGRLSWVTTDGRLVSLAG